MQTDNFEEKARKIRNHWFSKLPENKKDEIIKPAFEKEVNTNDKIKEIRKDMEIPF